MLNNDDDVIDGHVIDVPQTQYTSHTAATHFVTSSHDMTSSMASRESLERRTQHVIEQARQTMTKVTPIRTEVTTLTSSIRNIPTTTATASTKTITKSAVHAQSVQTLTSRDVTVRAHFGGSSLKNCDLNLSLHDAITCGVYDASRGVFVDPFTNDVMTLSEAVASGAIDGSAREVVNPVSGQRLPVRTVLHSTLMDAERALFHDPKTRKSMTLTEAADKGYVIPIPTLTSLYLNGDLDNEGRVTDRQGGNRKWTLLEAVETSLIDSDVSCVIDPQSGEHLSLTEALARGLIDENGCFVERKSGRKHSLLAAINSGRLVLTSREVRLAPRVVLDTATDERVTLAQALQTGCIDVTRAQFVDRRDGARMSLDDATDARYVSPSLRAHLQADSGLADSDGAPLTVLQALQTKRFNVDTGSVRDVSGSRWLTIAGAVETGNSSIQSK